MNCSATEIDWLACGPAMDFLRCSGCPLLAVFITIMRVWTVIEYSHTERIFREAMHKQDNHTSRTLYGLANVFRWCSFSGYGLLAFTVFGSLAATISYWAMAAALVSVNVWTHLLNRRLASTAGGIGKLLSEGQQAIDKLKDIERRSAGGVL